MKQWFNALEKREQMILIIGAVFVVFYLLYGVVYQGVVNQRQLLLKQNAAAEEKLQWVQQASQQIVALRKTSGAGGTSVMSGKSLSQISELAAKRSGLRITRFQPKDDNEAQVWLDRVEFSALIDFLVRLELDYGIELDDLSVNTANSPGLVNARLRFER